MKYRSTTIKSKWEKTLWLLGSEAVSRYVPRTLPFNRSHLAIMLNQFAAVYFKPTGGSGGANIMRIKTLKDGYELQIHARIDRYPTIDELYEQLMQRANGRSFMLQQGIDLAVSNGRPFDTRVMVQKTNDGRWHSTAIFTKIGMPDKVATNYNQGGKIGYFRQTMSEAGFDQERIKRTEEELMMLGHSVGRIFDIYGRGFKELGLDVALDREGRAWILEVNTRPQFYPLKEMDDKSMYVRILSYAKQYGRRS
ncbi:YheC/YheD family protein [Paenibacillus sp. LHD-117]|uniref:YheC/YheD family protein n=1 Tax=Paenibacillus sp. LHD-117 TaxID=3071412 RepID=UPI0027DEE11E|nr:YheC/YheD family protein [Paenibacillus sp. LHD-117]MDQ6423517.1 YheC/YheD family protein [Paenibacillus sp. LHD-117]